MATGDSQLPASFTDPAALETGTQTGDYWLQRTQQSFDEFEALENRNALIVFMAILKRGPLSRELIISILQCFPARQNSN